MERVLPFKFNGGTCLEFRQRGQGMPQKNLKNKHLRRNFLKEIEKKKNSMLFLLELGFV